MSTGQQCCNQLVDHMSLSDDTLADLRREFAPGGGESVEQREIVRVVGNGHGHGGKGEMSRRRAHMMDAIMHND